MTPLIDADVLRRVCKKCGEEKAITEFVKAPQCTHGHSHTCKLCNWKIRAPEYKRDRKKRSDIENQKNRAKKAYMVSKFPGGCHDCGNRYPDCVYDFHHLDPNEKDFKLSDVRTLDKNKIDKELAKCIMLCSNCHRMRHWLPRKEIEHGTATD